MGLSFGAVVAAVRVGGVLARRRDSSLPGLLFGAAGYAVVLGVSVGCSVLLPAFVPGLLPHPRGEGGGAGTGRLIRTRRLVCAPECPHPNPLPAGEGVTMPL